MVPTTQWMAETFDVYNTKYFGGRLPRPTFKIEPLKNEWGRFYINARYDSKRRIYGIKNGNGDLILNGKYDRAEKSLINTMLHEMVHEYIYLIIGIWPRNQHGSEFKSVATPINNDGWSIYEGNEVLDTDRIVDGNNQSRAEQSNNNERSCVICYFNLQSQGVNFWGCKVESTQVNETISTINKIGGTSPKFFKCYSRVLCMEKGNPDTLWGFGGNTIQEVASQFSQWCGEDVSVFLPNNQ